jgi:hypothetical protein
MKVSSPQGKETFEMTKRRKRHNPEQIVRMPRDAATTPEPNSQPATAVCLLRSALRLRRL